MNTSKVWDKVSNEFNTFNKNVYAGAKDNALTLWPIILNFAKKNCKKPFGSALEYGCGAGEFAGELAKLGFNTIGCDISPKMIAIGKKHLKNKVLFFTGDFKKVQKIKNNYELITGLMVFQFVKNFTECLLVLTKKLNPNGKIIFAVHHPEFLKQRNISTYLNAGGTKHLVPIFSRTAKHYDNIFTKLGYKKIFEKNLKSKLPYRSVYKNITNKKTKKFLVLAYQKITN